MTDIATLKINIDDELLKAAVADLERFALRVEKALAEVNDGLDALRTEISALRRQNSAA